METFWMYMWATERFRRAGGQLPAWALPAVVAGVVLAIAWIVEGPEWIDAWRARRAERRRTGEPPYPGGPAAGRCESPCQTSCQSACESSCQAGCQTTCEMSCQSSCEATCQAAAQVDIGAGAEKISASEIVWGAITTDRIATGSIDAEEIARGAPCTTPCQTSGQALEARYHPKNRAQELARTHNVNQLLLFTGDGAGSCSMSCDYCFLSKQGPLRIMSPETLRDAIAFLETLTDQPGLHFFGTEPTMQWDLIVEARRLRPSWPISLTTNGLLLTPDRIDWMANNDVRVYVYSIDGGALHNRHRRDARGRWTWGRVAAHLRYLAQSQGDWVTARATWTPDDYDLVGRFRALEGLGVRSIQVVPDIEAGAEWDEARVEQAYLELGEHYGWGRTPSRFVDEMVESIATGKPKPGYPCNFGRGSWAVMPDGELRACQRGERIGSIYEGITDAAPLYESALCAQIVNSRESLKPECSDCVAFRRCPGVGYCSAANRLAGNSAIPTEAHCQHLRGMVRACTVWAERRPKPVTHVIQDGVLGVVYGATQESA